MPIYTSRVVLELAKSLKLFLNLDVGLTRGPTPDFEQMLRQAQNRIKKQNQQLKRMRKRLSEKDRNLQQSRQQAFVPARTKAASNELRLTPPLPLPPGYSEQRLRELVTSVRVEGGPSEEMKNYANMDFRRFVYTLGLVPDEPGMTVLELGASPYFTTTLLHKFRDAELHLANFFDGVDREGAQKVTVLETGEEIVYRFKQFNVEKEAFPYEDDSFDVVLFCEIIEHLLSDPVHALLEVRRVLKSGGSLVLTTPNATRLENLGKMIDGQNVYDPYSGYGPYGRHNREYTRHELVQLLSANGFRPADVFTADVHDNYPCSHASLEEISALTAFRSADLGQYLFTRSSVDRDLKPLPPARPEWLYRSFHGEDSLESTNGAGDAQPPEG